MNRRRALRPAATALAFALASATSGPGEAHDVTFALRGAGDIHAVFRYSDDTPMAGAAFRVYGPAGETAATGVTDAAGEAAFRAEADGVWRVDVDDGKGHASRARFEVRRGLPSAGGGVPVWVTALSFAANILFAAGFLRRARAARLRPGPPGGRVAT